MTRTPPPVQPNGFEKSDAVLKVLCTPTEKLTWRGVFGKNLNETVRKYLHRKAAREAKLPARKRALMF